MASPRIGGGVEAANVPDDMISIYDGRLGIDSPPIWRKTMSHGLEGKAPLLEALRQEVDAAAQKSSKK